MNELIPYLNKVTKCKDGITRRLLRLEEGLAYYEIDTGYEWRELSGTYIGCIKRDFLEGKIIN